MKELLERYFKAWINKDINVLKDVFAENVVYSECYGPEYHGLNQILKWFSEWNMHADVLEWTIKQFISEGNLLVVEWYFKCNYDGEVIGFDGNSIVTFDKNGKIVNLKEFQSKAEHEFPFVN